MQEFFTKDAANDGVKLPLISPTGEATDHWLLVLGIDSDAAQAVSRKNSRMISKFKAAIKDKTPEETEQIQDDFQKDVELDAVAALVADWSFPKECTQENVKELLIGAPQIKNVIDAFSARRDFFLKKPSKPSPNGSSEKPG